MKHIYKLSLVAFFIVATGTPTYAKPLDSYRMATIDVNKVMNELSEAKTLKKRLDDKSKQARAKIEKERESLKSIESSLRSKNADPDSEEVEKFRAKARDFERMVKDSEEDIRREFMQENQMLTKKVLEAVKEYAEDNDIQLILDKSAPGRGPVLFGDPTADITSDVLRALN